MRHLIIGASAAGLTAAKTIRKQKPEDEITVVSTDMRVYARTMLHLVLSGRRTAEEINFVAEDFFEKDRVRWIAGETVARVDTAQNLAYLASGARIPYDRLLIASGAAYVVPQLPHFREAENVYGLRNLLDAEKLIAAAEQGKRCVIIGSGLVGLDAASALCARGVRCAVVELADRLSPLQLDAAASRPYQELFEKAGCTFHLSEKAAGSETDGRGRITSVLLESGTVLPCDFVVAAAGVRPAIGFLEGSGIRTGRGVEVDGCLRASLENVWAAGDAAGISGTWTEAMQQGEAAAKNMCGVETRYVNLNGAKNMMNYYGLSTLSLGVNELREGDQLAVQRDAGGYKRAILRDGVVTHVILQGDISDFSFWQGLIRDKVRVDRLEKPLFALTPADLSR